MLESKGKFGKHKQMPYPAILSHTRPSSRLKRRRDSAGRLKGLPLSNETASVESIAGTGVHGFGHVPGGGPFRLLSFIFVSGGLTVLTLRQMGGRRKVTDAA